MVRAQPDSRTIADHPGRPTRRSPSALERVLRQAVLDHIGSERRRTFPPTVHVGLPGLAVAALPIGDEHLDHALRTDAVEALLRRLRDDVGRGSPEVLMWLTRPGTLETQDLDLAWASAARTAAVELGLELTMVVVTRQGWSDPRSGAARTWRRLRRPR